MFQLHQTLEKLRRSTEREDPENIFLLNMKVSIICIQPANLVHIYPAELLLRSEKEILKD